METGKLLTGNPLTDKPFKVFGTRLVLPLPAFIDQYTVTSVPPTPSLGLVLAPVCVTKERGTGSTTRQILPVSGVALIIQTDPIRILAR